MFLFSSTLTYNGWGQMGTGVHYGKIDFFDICEQIQNSRQNEQLQAPKVVFQ